MQIAPWPLAFLILVFTATLQEVAISLQTKAAPHQTVEGILYTGAAPPWVVAAHLQEGVQGRLSG